MNNYFLIHGFYGNPYKVGVMMKEEILKKVDILYAMYKKGSLGGEIMPEDENPHLEKSSLENYLYFTLPMALNYQRNSYTLWESANKRIKILKLILSFFQKRF